MNTVTFETALALKDAGFPQPFPAFGQQWYFPETKELFLVTFVYSNGKVDYCMEGSLVVMLEDMPESSVFAPTATDILEQLPDFYYVRKGTCDNLPIFSVFDEKEVNCSNIAILAKAFGKNPHEAAAKAFLEPKKAGK